MALGVFIPAFSFTLIGHNFFERVLDHPRLIVFLDGVTASVVGLIIVVTITLLQASLPNPVSVVFFGAALVFLYTVKHKAANVLLVLTGALAGELAFAGPS
jgi:chromate transporter